MSLFHRLQGAQWQEWVNSFGVTGQSSPRDLSPANIRGYCLSEATLVKMQRRTCKMLTTKWNVSVTLAQGVLQKKESTDGKRQKWRMTPRTQQGRHTSELTAVVASRASSVQTQADRSQHGEGEGACLLEEVMAIGSLQERGNSSL